MVLMLEKRGFIRRVPGQARSITLLVPVESLPALKRIDPRRMEDAAFPSDESGAVRFLLR